jgi:(heptosyl)LPS beta-1,4-glucosyltransferase
MKNKLSVGIICKNEQDNLANCLQSVAFADEIIVLDSGSTDNTIDIARRFTEKIFVRDDWRGFGEQRRRVEDLASHDWILMVDSDEVVSDQLRTEILRYLQTATANQVFRVNRLTYFCGQYIHHSGWYPDRICRLYNRQQYRYNHNLVHESLDCKGADLIELSGDLLHYTFSDLSVYLQKRTKYANAWAEEQYLNGNNYSLLKAISSSLFAFIRHYILRSGFLDGRVGFIIATIQMQYTFNKYVLLLMKYKLAGKEPAPQQPRQE